MRDVSRHQSGEAVRFLGSMYLSRDVHLVAIADRGMVEAKSFAATEVARMHAWLEQRQGKANLYFHVNELKADIRNAKARKENIAAALFLHVDVDDPSGLQRLKNYIPIPTAVVFSGGGYQAFWRLAEPCVDLDLVERCNLKIAQDLGGDNCQNVDRIMRVPGTVNIPNAKKRAAGRTEALAHVV